MVVKEKIWINPVTGNSYPVKTKISEYGKRKQIEGKWSLEESDD